MKKMKKAIRKNRRMGIERYACLCGTPDTCIAQCMGSVALLSGNTADNAMKSQKNSA